MQLLLGPEVFLHEPGLLRPAEVGEAFQHDIADGRAGAPGALVVACCAPQLADQVVALAVESRQHAFLGEHLRYQVGNLNVVIARVVHQLLLDAQGFLKGGYKLVADHHTHIVTLVPCYESMANDRQRRLIGGNRYEVPC